jgi:hypothetical protein
MTRVRARLDEEVAPRRPRPVLAAAGLAAVAIGGVLVLALVPRLFVSSGAGGGIATTRSAGLAPAADTGTGVPADALARIENTLERERAARYLSDAQDVLVTVAASPQRCARRHGAVEVGEEAERSRDLLARRRLYVESDGAATVVARDVLDDVEEMLRQVAALDACARPADLEAIRDEIARRRLLMKIDLVTRELQG